jgi:hypothetical protein
MAGNKKGQKLSAMQRRAADAYIDNGFRNKLNAMRIAGYADTTASAAANKVVFHQPKVIAYIEAARERLQRKYDVTKDFVVQRMARLANSGEILAKYRYTAEDGSLYWDFTDATADDLSVISGMTVETYADGRGDEKVMVKKFKIDVPDPKGALDSLARVIGLFNDKVTVQGEVSLIERLQRGRERAKAKDGGK